MAASGKNGEHHSFLANLNLKRQALDQLASTDLIELCNEAKIERCRSARDLSSCARNVEHVLGSCGHASLCAECSQRCDVCPICRTCIPKHGSKVHLRLYYKCIEAGLIPKQQDDRFQEKEDDEGHLMADIQRLYALFDVALKNNLVSLICHYVTDVCMDESAVSSDPVLAFLLDEVVVKDWCKQSFSKIICDLQKKYSLGVEKMRSELSCLQKSMMHLTGISNVLEVMVSSFKETFSGQLNDLHHLLENVLKAKQHLEVMIWCARHQFLEKIQSRYPNYASWGFHVHERKSAAVKRAWPDISSYSTDSAGSDGSLLFIEEALSNLGIEQDNGKESEEVDLCLQDKNSPSLFQPVIDETDKNEGIVSYPFESVRAATDILFLRGTSDMLVAKHATFLYYLFDRHWTRPDQEWRHVVDDFAMSFGISRRSLLESLAFCLLDDHSDHVVQEASNLLVEIAGAETHPKIAQVLLEHQRPDVALTVLQCVGHDAFSAHPRSEHGESQCIAPNEAIAAVRARIESGLLTEAFIYQRMYCSKVKERASSAGSSMALPSNCKTASWLNQVEILVSEICHLCIRRNLVDKMIELPWNSHEEVFLHKCLIGHACQNPASIHGSLLVVFYLQRYRYVEAYQVDRKLQRFEQNFFETADEDTVYRIQSLSHWRTGLVDKSVDLLPEVQRQQVIAGSMGGLDLSFSQDVQTSPKSGLTSPLPISAPELTPSFTQPSHILQKSSKHFPSRKVLADTHTNFTGTVINAQLASGNKVSSVVQHRLLASFTSPPTRMNSVLGKIPSSNSHDDDNSPSNDVYSGDMRWPDARRGFRSSGPSLSSSFQPAFQITKDSSMKVPNYQLLHGNEMKPDEPISHEQYTARFTAENDSGPMDTSHGNGLIQYPKISETPWRAFSEEANSKNLSYGKRDSPVEDSNMKAGSRWRSDESSEDADDGLDKHTGATPFAIRRPTRFSRR